MHNKLKKMMKGSSEGYCRICGEYDKLTEDHIPPHGCGNNSIVTIRNFEGHISYSQNGSKVKTICSECNNKRLGIDSDSELVRIYNEVKSNYSSIIQNPNREISITVNPQKIIKSICGHLLAIMVGDEVARELSEKPIMTDYLTELRDFVIYDKSMKSVTVFYWFYPHDEMRIIQYFGKIPDVSELNNVIYGSIFKFFPFGFWIVNSKSSTCFPRFNVMPQDISTYVMKLNIRNVLHESKPEMPESNGLILINGGNFIDIKKKRNDMQ